MYSVLIPTTQMQRVKQDLIKYPIDYKEEPIQDANGKVYFTRLDFDVSGEDFKEIAAFIRSIGVDAYGIDTQITGPASLMEIMNIILPGNLEN